MKTTKMIYTISAFLALLVTTVNAQTALNSKTEFAEINGKKIAYRTIGKGKPIILVNRFRGTLDTWDPLFLDKLAQNYKVITFDYTGIGSSTGTLPTNVVSVATDVKDLADYLKLKSIYLLGWSYGGTIAQVATIQYPQLISHSILIGTGPPGKNNMPLEKAFLERALKPINDEDDEIVLFFEPNSAESIKASKLSHDRIAKRLDVSKIPSTQAVFDLYFKGGADFREDKANFREQLKTTKTPILVISGDHDISFAVENWFALNRQLSSTQIIVYPKTGHAAQHQYPELTVKYITNFITETSK